MLCIDRVLAEWQVCRQCFPAESIAVKNDVKEIERRTL